MSDGITIYDAVSTESKKIDLDTPYYVAWGPSNRFWVLYKKGPDKKLCAVSTNKLQCEEIFISKVPEAIFPVPDSTKLIVVSGQITTASLWSDVYYELSVHDYVTGLPRTVHKSNRTLPTKNPDIDFMSGWINQGPSPFDTTFLTMEYVKPPVFPSQLKIGIVDYLTGKISNIGQIPHNKFSVQASWSPDGRRFALPGTKGNLMIMNIDGEVFTPDKEIIGWHPSWNPKGSQIFIGGYLLNSDGSKREELVAKGMNSRAFWSPDGLKMVLHTNNSLWLLNKFSPSLISPDRLPDKNLLKKIVLLKDLFIEKLISEDEYNLRYKKLLEKDAPSR